MKIIHVREILSIPFITDHPFLRVKIKEENKLINPNSILFAIYTKKYTYYTYLVPAIRKFAHKECENKQVADTIVAGYENIMTWNFFKCLINAGYFKC